MSDSLTMTDERRTRWIMESLLASAHANAQAAAAAERRAIRAERALRVLVKMLPMRERRAVMEVLRDE